MDSIEKLWLAKGHYSDNKYEKKIILLQNELDMCNNPILGRYKNIARPNASVLTNIPYRNIEISDQNRKSPHFRATYLAPLPMLAVIAGISIPSNLDLSNIQDFASTMTPQLEELEKDTEEFRNGPIRSEKVFYGLTTMKGNNTEPRVSLEEDNYQGTKEKITYGATKSEINGLWCNLYPAISPNYALLSMVKIGVDGTYRDINTGLYLLDEEDKGPTRFNESWYSFAVKSPIGYNVLTGMVEDNLGNLVSTSKGFETIQGPMKTAYAKAYAENIDF